MQKHSLEALARELPHGLRALQNSVVLLTVAKLS